MLKQSKCKNYIKTFNRCSKWQQTVCGDTTGSNQKMVMTAVGLNDDMVLRQVDVWDKGFNSGSTQLPCFHPHFSVCTIKTSEQPKIKLSNNKKKKNKIKCTKV